MKKNIQLKIVGTIAICLIFWGLHVATSPTREPGPKYDPVVLFGNSNKVWKLSQHYINMKDSTMPCEKDNTYTFKNDFNYVISEGQNVCSGQISEKSGSFELNYALTLYYNGDYEQFDLERYTDSLVVMKYIDKGLLEHHLVLRP